MIVGTTFSVKIFSAMSSNLARIATYSGSVR